MHRWKNFPFLADESEVEEEAYAVVVVVVVVLQEEKDCLRSDDREVE